MKGSLHAHMCSSCWQKLEHAIHAPTLSEATHLRSIAAQLSRCKRKECKTAAAACRAGAKLMSVRKASQEIGDWLKL